MSVTEIAGRFDILRTRKVVGDIVFEKDGISVITEYVAHNEGLLVVKSYRNYNITPKQIIEVLAGCFEDGCELQEVLRVSSIFEEKESLEGIIISIKNIPVLVSRKSHNVEEIYKNWSKSLQVE